MPKNRRPKSTLLYITLLLACALALVVFLLLVFYHPDRPSPVIVPGSSSKPTFSVQVIRPRVGLPIGGLLPPELFGLDAHLGFDSESDGATIQGVHSDRIELGAKNWELFLALDKDGRVTKETHVTFRLVFEDRPRTVRCFPDGQGVGTVTRVTLSETGELAGSFEIELANCEDAETGAPLGWPPSPLILHGSFDRLPLESLDDKPDPKNPK